ncbi:MAG: deoxynucleoside kinase [Deltaproteobacteria bacterium]|nr:deoxynucleoside kinase [Deltaproteobacteria bacterium]
MADRLTQSTHRYIVVEGPIGVGKTTLTKALARRFSARTVFEIVEENPFLANFYQDKNKFAFQTQLFFLLSRFKQQQELFQQDLFAQVTVSDYLFAKDRIFASITLDPNELSLYERIYEHLGPRVMKPDLVVYLQARQDILLGRIKKRAREFERKFDADYLAELSRTYNDFFHRYEETPLLIINTSDVDYSESEEALDEPIAKMNSIKAGAHWFSPMGRK